MAWIEVHQTLPTHRKTIAAAALLDITPVQVVGHLVCLWLWALDNAPDGVMYASRNALRNKMVATVSQWGDDPDTFVGALVEAGFLNEQEDALEIHDWQDYAGKLMETRKANRERQRRYREAKKQKEKNAKSDDNVTRDKTVTKGERHASTVPYPTVPNNNINNIIVAAADAPATTPESGNKVKKKKVYPEDSPAYQLAVHLRDAILSTDPTTKVPSSLQEWAHHADLLLRVDNRDPTEARELITWSQQDAFWSTNCLSMRTFRRQYDKLKRRRAADMAKQGREDPDAILDRIVQQLEEVTACDG